MANRGLEDFDGSFYDGRFSAPQSAAQDENNNAAQSAQLPSYAQSMPVGNYAYSHNPMLSYDPAADTSLSMGLGSATAFPYDLSTYASSTTPLGHGLDNLASTQSQAPGADNVPAFSTSQPQGQAPNMYWTQPQATGNVGSSAQSALNRPLGRSHTADSSGQIAQARQGQQSDRLPQTSLAGPSHRFIQPKSQPGKGFPVLGPKPEATGRSSPYPNIYSRSGFDMMGILAQVVSRPEPKINLGPVDLSCAFVLCDVTLEDSPIVYVSNAFERLTGYSEKEIIGHNCRFLQGPHAKVEKGEPRKFTDSYTAYRLRDAVDALAELQVSIINYRKGGQPFMNLVTTVPVRWESKDYYVGFQVDLVEKPDAVTKKNPDGSYMINYNRSQLPPYVVPSPGMYQGNDQPEPVQYGSAQVATILDNLIRGQLVAGHHIQHMLVENTDDVIFVLSYEGEFLYLSPSCRKVLEYKSSDLVGKTLSTICHPSDIGPVTRDLRSCTSGDPISVIYRIRRKNTGYTWFENHGGWHITERGRQFMVLVGRLIPVYSPTQLVNLERSGLAENDLWAKLSLSGIILFMSSKSRAVLGRSSDDLAGKNIQDIFVNENTQQESEFQQALETSRGGQQITFTHKVRHRKGHVFTAQITFYPGDLSEGISKPAFLIAHLRFPKPLQLQSVSIADDTSQSHSQSSSDAGVGDKTTTEPATTASSASTTLQPKPHPNFPAPFTTSPATLALPTGSPRNSASSADSADAGGGGVPLPTSFMPHLFEELNPTRGSSWHFELRELEKQNRSLAEDAQRLLARRKKRKRKQSAAVVEKSCAMCQTRTTPEWRRGPSGNRDLCNSCGLRWAKQVRNAGGVAAAASKVNANATAGKANGQ
ncbi:GATA transcription factor LreA [Aspergillus stella-maris]|uniref:GATA transcription factor LreA n=1 Tax=Aspergillus stella-maris TaxID=1810926 RepID=UPI003CCE2EF7